MFVRSFGSGRFCAYVVLDEADGCLHRVVAVLVFDFSGALWRSFKVIPDIFTFVILDIYIHRLERAYVYGNDATRQA